MMKKKKKSILFIVTSFWSYGELQIALDFASRLDSDQWSILFLASRLHEGKVASYGFKCLKLTFQSAFMNRLMLADIEQKCKPDLVILSDFICYQSSEEHYGLGFSDLNVLSGRVGAFDLYEYAKSSGIDSYGSPPVIFNPPSIEQCNFLLRPSPICRVNSEKEKNIYTYSLVKKEKIDSLAPSEHAKEQFAFPLNKKAILLPLSGWQFETRAYPEDKGVRRYLIEILEKIILILSHRYYVVVLGANPFSISKQQKNICFFGQVSAEKFSLLENAIDLVISNNYISTTVMTLAVKGVPTLLLKNSYVKCDGKSHWTDNENNGRDSPDALGGIDELYPIRVFPVGWYYFLEHLIDEKSVYSFIEQAEIGDPDEVVEKVAALLGPSEMRAARRQAFITHIKALPECCDLDVFK